MNTKTKETRARELFAMVYGKHSDQAAAQIRMTTGWLKLGKFVLALETKMTAKESPPKQPTSQQIEIVVQEASGLPQKQIAANLGISPKAIDWHLRKFREVTGLGCIALRTRWAIRNGLIAACWLLALLGLATNGLAQPMPRVVVVPAPDTTYPAQLAWSSVKDATAYRLFYGTNGTNGITWEQNTTVIETNLTLPLPIGPTYYFKVRAQQGIEESDDSNIAMLNTSPGPYLNYWQPVIAMSWATPAGQTSILQFSTQEGEWSDVLETTNAITATTQALVGVQGKWRTRYK